MDKKKAKHLSEVLKAFSEGKTIQRRYYDIVKGQYLEWFDVFDGDEINFEYYEYRVKPDKPTLRPYQNVEEFLNAQKEHGMYLVSKKDKNKILMPINVSCDRIFMYFNSRDSELTGYMYSDLLNYWVHQDGTPCGILEE